MPLPDRHYLINTSQRATFEALHTRTQDTSIQNLDDLGTQLAVNAPLLEEYLAKWFYNDDQITFDIFKQLTREQLAQAYQLPSVVYQLEETNEYNEYLDIVIDDSLRAETQQFEAQNVTINIPEQDIIEVDEEKLDGSPNQFDANFLLSIIDPRPMFSPMTVRRALWWIVLLTSISGITYAAIKDDIFSGLKKWAELNSIPAMVVLYMYEPLLLALEMLTSNKYPDELPQTNLEAQNQILENQMQSPQIPISPACNFIPDLAIIIPCHNSAAFIAQTIKAALRHVAPNKIFIMDNDREENPSDNTQEIVHSIHPDINYFWLPKTGNKTVALAVGAEYVAKHRPELTKALVLDDDTEVPDNYDIRLELFEDNCVQGIVYPIRGKSPYNKAPYVSRWQDLEYLLADLENAFFDQSDSVYRPHGAASLWLITTLVKILRKHNTVFKGEDVEMGRIMQVLPNENGGCKLRLDQDHYFETTVPQTFFGESPNLYQQRVRGWIETMYLYPWNLMIKPLLMNHRGSPISWLKVKNSELYNLYTHIIYILRFPFAVLVGGNPQYWAVLGGIKGIETIMALTFNYLKLPHYLRNDLLTVLTYPLYKEALSAMGTLSFLRVLFVSGASAPHPRSLNHQLGHGLITISEEAKKPRTYNQAIGIVNQAIITEVSNVSPLAETSFIRTESIALTEVQSKNMDVSSVQTFFSKTQVGVIEVNPINSFVPQEIITNFLEEHDQQQEDTNSAKSSESTTPTHQNIHAFFQQQPIPIYATEDTSSATERNILTAIEF